MLTVRIGRRDPLIRDDYGIVPIPTFNDGPSRLSSRPRPSVWSAAFGSGSGSNAASTLGGDMGELWKRMPSALWTRIADRRHHWNQTALRLRAAHLADVGLGTSIITASSIGRSDVTGVR